MREMIISRIEKYLLRKLTTTESKKVLELVDSFVVSPTNEVGLTEEEQELWEMQNPDEEVKE